MKLFQKLYTGLNRRSCLKHFSIYSPGGHFVNRAEQFKQFWWTVTYGTFLYNYFKIEALVKEKSFKGFSVLSSGGHLVQRSGTV